MTARPQERPSTIEGETVSENSQAPWGRVDDDNNVYVRDGGSERLVGQFPDATPEEALAYFERKYQDLAGQVTLLEQRIKRGASASDVRPTVDRLTEQLESPAAVGNIPALRERVEALRGDAEKLTEQQKAEHREAVEAARAEREKIVEAAEKLAAQDPSKIQWKQTAAEMDALFHRWQEHQKSAVRLAKNDAEELWKRFRNARKTLDTERRSFFARLDDEHREARTAKQDLVRRAEALAPRGSDAIGEYRALLDDWKRAGRAGRKYDDQLWAQFKAAGDVLFQAKNEEVAQENVEYEANLEKKLSLLNEAEPLKNETNHRTAREKLTAIQRRWDEAGRVPRQRFREVEDRMRAVEDHVKRLEETHWRESNPEKKARSTGLQAQLEDAIAKLEKEAQAARERGDEKAVKEAEESLAARKTWLDALG